MAEARRRLAAAEAAVGVAKSARWPEVRLAGNYLSFGGGSTRFETEWNAGVQVSVPLFDGGATGKAIARTKASHEVARQRLRQAELDVASEIDLALAALDDARARAESLTTAVARLEEVVRIQKLLLETGQGTQTDYLDAEADLLAARLRAHARAARRGRRPGRAGEGGRAAHPAVARGEPGEAFMKPKRIVVLPVVVLALGAAAFFLLRDGHDDPGVLVASGTVEATEARLGFPVSGRIEAVTVQEGDQVEPGQELGRLDQAESSARRDQALAQVAAARAQLRELEPGFRTEEVAEARAAAAAAAERLADAERDLERTRRLLEGGAVSREAYDKAASGSTWRRASTRRPTSSSACSSAVPGSSGSRPSAPRSRRPRPPCARWTRRSPT